MRKLGAALLCAFIWGLASAPQMADAIVVLGAAQYNGRPSPVFANRLNAALVLYRQGYAPTILVTGGKQPGDRYSEGEVGCRYLEAAGVPKSALICETHSRSTWENLKNAAALLGSARVLIVTDAPHLPRAMMLAQRLGINAGGYPVPGRFSLEYRWREAVLRLLTRFGLTEGPPFLKSPGTPRATPETVR